MCDWTEKQIQGIRNAVEEVTGISLPFEVSVRREKDLKVRLENGRAEIAAEDLSAAARGFFLLSGAVRKGQSSLDLHQTRHFRDCGPMLDVSRGGVMTVEAVRKYLRQCAALGMNFLMLYTEDVYEIPEYPAFGYLRGRYTREELRELDDYADSLGIELIPCVQTLAHLEQFLQWGTVPRDQASVLMIDDEETYRFIAAEFRALRACFRSKRIHIGMDEAQGVGQGQYFLNNGPADRYDLMNRHLARVAGLSREAGFEPMIWSDMYFRLASKDNSYYDPEVRVPDEIIADIPDVGLVYWDYYHTEEDFYDHMLSEHQRLGRRIGFAGGIWTWSGFLPQVQRTVATMSAALPLCARREIPMVIATLWNDDGAETDMSLGVNLLPMFSEYCWLGEDCRASDWQEASETLTGLPWEVYEAFGEGYPGASEIYAVKRAVWGDPLYPLNLFREDPAEALEARCEKALEKLASRTDRPDCSYAARVLQLAARKAHLMGHLRPWYQAGDRENLVRVRDELIPELISLTETLAETHRDQWEAGRKRFGWEILALRYGAAVGRLKDVQHELDQYLTGRIPRMEELEAEPVPVTRWQTYFHMVTPGALIC